MKHFLIFDGSISLSSMHLDNPLTPKISKNTCDRSLWPLMSAPADAPAIRAIQNITAYFLNRTEHFQSVIEIEPDSLRIILLGNGGQRIATITYIDRQMTATTEIKLPMELPLNNILETIQLIYFSTDQLNAHLNRQHNTDWLVKQQDNHRQVFFQQKLYAQIEYRAQDPWNGQTEYQNVKYDHRFIINSSLLP